MSNFYSSVTIHEGLVIFNANDYHLYVYNKKDGSLKWSVETNYKSTIPVFVQDSIIYAAISKKEIHQAAQFDLANGDLKKALPFGPLATKPLIKTGVWYPIYNFGCILAYDLEKIQLSGAVLLHMASPVSLITLKISLWPMQRPIIGWR
ncbi:MAG: hypothetical protein IPO01_04565 [Chitinophagaceae bacterium]|nr:hypothetical protein [Chitinophagaceae bacterium]